jgi:hypothetical protein
MPYQVRNCQLAAGETGQVNEWNGLIATIRPGSGQLCRSGSTPEALAPFAAVRCGNGKDYGIDFNVPLSKQPFGYIEPILVILAPRSKSS